MSQEGRRRKGVLGRAWDWLTGGQAERGEASVLSPRLVAQSRLAGGGVDQPAITRVSGRDLARSHRVARGELTGPFSLDRVERLLTGPMGYGVERRVEDGRVVLRGAWNGFPFLFEEPEDHDGTLMVTADWTEPAPLGQREEIAASVNDWNREKFFPTVCLVDTAAGPLVRVIYLVDLSTGVSDAQLRLHLDSALASCTQALEQVGPLLPEL